MRYTYAFFEFNSEGLNPMGCIDEGDLLFDQKLEEMIGAHFDETPMSYEMPSQEEFEEDPEAEMAIFFEHYTPEVTVYKIPKF